jgi:hypothetical protein
MADRSIPEGVVPPKLANKKPGFMNPNAMNAVKQKARLSALKAKALQGKNGTAHQQHLAHEEHMQHVRNVANKNAKSKNPYNT